MKKLAIVVMMFLMIFGGFTLPTSHVWAGEHGGSTIREAGGGSVLKGTPDDAATLNEAAAALKSSNPELAKKLEKMAQEQCGI